MSLSPRTRLRWLAPTGAAVLIAAVSGAATLTGAQADATLRPRTASQLIADVASARLSGVSGTVTQTSNLGLGDVSALTGGANRSADLTGILSGTHTWRLWYAGPDKVRLALLGRQGESDVIRNGSDVWIWSSAQNTARHLRVPARTGHHAASQKPAEGGAAAVADLTPQQLADRMIATADPSTEIASAGTTSVAGRPAHLLQLTPKGDTLVKQIRIAIDADHHVPLSVQIYSTRISAPAIEVAFTSVKFAMPDASQFAFNPPPGTTVIEGTGDGPPATGSADKKNEQGTHGESGSAALNKLAGAQDRTAAPRTVGTGWASVVLARSEDLAGMINGSAAAADGSSSGKQLSMLIAQLPTATGSWGSGKVFEGTLFTVLLADDGRVAAGAVPAQRLYELIGTP